MKTIPLSQGYEAMVDDEDYKSIVKHKWCVKFRKNPNFVHVYAITNIKKSKGRWTTCPMHRMILNPPKGMVVDHIDNNGLNNCKNNIRIVTNQQNICRMRKSKGRSSSQYRGVMKTKNGRWEANIKHNYKSYYIGIFSTEQEAATAWNKKAQEVFGEWATLNVIS